MSCNSTLNGTVMKIFGWTVDQWLIVGVQPMQLAEIASNTASKALIERVVTAQKEWWEAHAYPPGESPLVDQEGRPLQ